MRRLLEPVALTKRTAVILAAIVLVAFLVGGWKLDRNSCMRQEGVRGSAALVASTAAKARRADAKKKDITAAERDEYLRLAGIYEEAAREAAPLSCSGPFPDTH